MEAAFNGLDFGGNIFFPLRPWFPSSLCLNFHRTVEGRPNVFGSARPRGVMRHITKSPLNIRQALDIYLPNPLLGLCKRFTGLLASFYLLLV